jgi:hypothetical protein
MKLVRLPQQRDFSDPSFQNSLNTGTGGVIPAQPIADAQDYRTAHLVSIAD